MIKCTTYITYDSLSKLYDFFLGNTSSQKDRAMSYRNLIFIVLLICTFARLLLSIFQAPFSNTARRSFVFLFYTFLIFLWVAVKLEQKYTKHCFCKDYFKSYCLTNSLFQYVFSEAGISIQTSVSYKFFSWKSIDSFSSDSEFYYFSVSNNYYLIDKKGVTGGTLTDFEMLYKNHYIR